MLDLPETYHGNPDTGSPARLLVWVGRRQLRTLSIAIGFGIVWMLAQALMPFTIGRAIDAGIVADDGSTLALWALGLLGLGVAQAGAGVMRHRYAVQNWLQAAFVLVQMVGHHAARTGQTLRLRITTGEIVATVSSDALRAGGAFDITARLSGAIVSYAVVSVILLTTSMSLGLVVIIGVPVLVTTLGSVIRPLQERQREQREQVGRLTALGADTAAGLRVLRGIGGEQAFFDRYVARSQRVRRAGVAVAGPQSLLDASQVLLPGVFVVFVTWVGARLVLSGDIQPGDLVAFYGYAAFLVIPMRTAAEAVDKITRALVGARRILSVLAVERTVVDPVSQVTPPPEGVGLVDTISGVVVEPRALTCLVSSVPEESAAIAARLGRLTDEHGVTLGGVALTDLPLASVRSRIVVSEQDPILFSGTLRSQLDPWGGTDDASLLEALRVANAGDVLDALPDGLDTQVDERGRSFSGGQRQRLVLARTLVASPDVLVLIEPTSAVDAHTEARIARELRAARDGRATAIATTSPLVLDHADRVILIENGRAVVAGTHRELLASHAGYRDTVTRGESE